MTSLSLPLDLPMDLRLRLRLRLRLPLPMPMRVGLRLCSRAVRRSAAWTVIAASALGGPASALAEPVCPLTGRALTQGAVQAAWRVDGSAVPKLGQLFALTVQLCPADATLLRVDATMPEHRHGMNYRPSVQRLPDGRWRAEGLMFHMPGRWELRLDVQSAGRTERLLDSLVLP